MSQFDDCNNTRRERDYYCKEEKVTEVRIPITVTGSGLAIVLECSECSKEHNLCKELKKEKKCKKC